VNDARAFWPFLGRLLVLLARDRQLVFWNAGFFLVLLLIFLGPLSGGDAAVRVTLAAGLVTTQIMASALFSIGVGLTAARERGVFRRYAVTPAPAGLLLGGTITARALLVWAAALMQIVAAAAVFGVPWTGGVASWMALTTAGTAAFAGVGFAIAAHARAPHVANTLANLVFVPMLALGGTALPASMMPEPWANVHAVLPSAAMFDGFLGAFIGGETAADNLGRLGYLMLWAVVFTGLGAYRWNRHAA
jgi:ABC-2 type transport system permease protein